MRISDWSSDVCSSDLHDLARRPRETVNLSADYRFPFALSLGGTVSVVGDSYDDAGNVTRLDGYVLAGVRAELPIGERFAFYGRVENLFDARYPTVFGHGTVGRAAYGGGRRGHAWFVLRPSCLCVPSSPAAPRR